MRLIRRAFDLPDGDRRYLDELGRPWETVTDGKQRWVIVHDWPVCNGYNHDRVAIAALVQSGYPEAQLDMIYVLPALQRADGVPIPNLSPHPICGKQWQRWSRHRTRQNPWRVGVDDLASHFVLVDHWFAREFIRRSSPCSLN